MKLDAMKFGIASAISASVLWVICSTLVMLMPAMTMGMSGSMFHMQFNDMDWHLSFGGVVSGLIAWAVMAGVAGWLIAAVYNRLQ